MASFDPRTQTFTLLAGDGVTEIHVSVAEVDYLYHEHLSICINYGAQIGGTFVMLLVLVCMAQKAKLIKMSQWVHIAGLIVNILRQTFLALYHVGDWTEFYAWWSRDFSHVRPLDYNISVASEIASMVLFVIVQVALGLQAWAMVSLFSPYWKWVSVSLSGVLSAVAVALRFGAAVTQVDSILTITPPDPLWLAKYASILGAATIFYYCALFNTKLIMHLIKHRGILPSIRGLTAMEVLVITNGLLMIIPVTFAGLAWGEWRNFEPGSLINTSVIIFLPLGTLIAQRVATPASYYNSGRDLTGTGYSSTPLKFGSQGGTDAGDSTVVGSTVTSRIEGGGRPRDVAVDPVDLELRQIDSGDLEKGGVRVNREVERYEEKA